MVPDRAHPREDARFDFWINVAAWLVLLVLGFLLVCGLWVVERWVTARDQDDLEGCWEKASVCERSPSGWVPLTEDPS